LGSFVIAILTALILTGIGTGREETERRKWHVKQDLYSEQKKDGTNVLLFVPGGQ
jgi:hypothetical protein